MNRVLIITTVLAGGLLAACNYGETSAEVPPGSKVPAFTLTATGSDGETREIDSQALDSATALVFMSVTCPYCEDYADRLAHLSASYGKEGVDFVYVYPNRKEADEAKQKDHQDKSLGGSFANDPGAETAKALDITRTPEVVLLSKEGEIVYRGGVDDDPSGDEAQTAYVAKALDEHLAGRPVTTTSAPAPG